MSLSPNAFVPLDALRLVEDIRALDEARQHLETVDVRNITEDREVGWKILQLLKQELRLCHRYAENKLRKEFLAPKKKLGAGDQLIERNRKPRV
jgi:hypothetical protein